MTLVVGLTVSENSSGVPILDGGCTIVEDGEVRVAVSEERLIREKYAPGFQEALYSCLEYVGVDLLDVDQFVFSNCLDQPMSPTRITNHLRSLAIEIPKQRITVCDSHHRSHAASAFFSSPFQQALIFTIDNTGNVLYGDYGRHELNGVERTSVYWGKDSDIQLLDRHHDGCSELGIGAAYKYVSLYLGFDTYKDAGKVMGMAAYGDGALSEYRFFDDDWNCMIPSNPYDRGQAVRRCLTEQGLDPGPPKTDTESPSELQQEIAWLIQRDLERVILEMAGQYVERTGCQTLCYAGGVALNCVANAKILRETDVEHLFIPPAPGDYGQCLGNALYGYYNVLGNERDEGLTSVYLGRKYGDGAISSALEQYSDQVEFRRVKNVPELVASRLQDGKIVGHYHGRSEFGPRALGNRSILADPRNPETKSYVNESVKFREEYRPFAPSILREAYSDFFDDEWAPLCRYMLLAQPVKDERRRKIPATVHVNDTARLQTVSTADNPRFYAIIEAFANRTGIPVVLNTSFNLAGEPIVERPEDAIDTYLRSGMDILVLDNYVVEAAVNS